MLPGATVVLDWFHIAMRFEHILRPATGVGADTIDAHLGAVARRDMERAKWCLWHGRWQRRCLVKLVTAYRWTEAKCVRDAAGIETLRRHPRDLIDYLEANTATLVNFGARRGAGKAFSPVTSPAVGGALRRAADLLRTMPFRSYSSSAILLCVSAGPLRTPLRRVRHLQLSRYRPSLVQGARRHQVTGQHSSGLWQNRNPTRAGAASSAPRYNHRVRDIRAR